MPEPEQLHDTALRSANQALAGRRHRDSGGFGTPSVRLEDPRVGAWEMAAMASVAVASALAVIGLWCW